MYKLIYRGYIHPFNLSCIYSIILSKKGKEGLKKFLKQVLIHNMNNLPSNDIRKLDRLQQEVIKPDSINTLHQNEYYVIYRCQRTFSAVVFVPDKTQYIIESHLAYINCGNNENKAYFYAAALNYLAYKAIQLRRSFVRDQFARPIYALIDAELTWRSFVAREPETLGRIVDLSKALHILVPKKFGNMSYALERTAFKDLESMKEFKELVSLFNKYIEEYVGKEQFVNALSWVTG